MRNDLVLTPEDVTDIVAILDGTPYQRLEIRTSRFLLRIACSGDGWVQEWNWDRPTVPPVSANNMALAAAEETRNDSAPIAIRAPLPGTFYRAPQPGAPPFVKEGDKIGSETVVGIIETMKLMSPVYAGHSGFIVQILAKDGMLVDADMVLMRAHD